MLVPIVLILVGIILLYLDGTSYTSVSLIGSVFVLIGILTLGALLVSILAIYLSARVLENNRQTKKSFRERIEAEEESLNLKKENEITDTNN